MISSASRLPEDGVEGRVRLVLDHVEEDAHVEEDVQALVLGVLHHVARLELLQRGAEREAVAEVVHEVHLEREVLAVRASASACSCRSLSSFVPSFWSLRRSAMLRVVSARVGGAGRPSAASGSSAVAVAPEVTPKVASMSAVVKGDLAEAKR